jgi:hypothetical protein
MMRTIILMAALCAFALAPAAYGSRHSVDDCNVEREQYAAALRAWHASGRDDVHRRIMLTARAAYETCNAQSQSQTLSSLWVTRGLEGRDWNVRAELTLAGGHVEINARTFFQGAWRPWRGSGTVTGETLRFTYEVETGNTYGWLNGAGELTFQNEQTVLVGHMRAIDGSWFSPVMLFRSSPDSAASPDQAIVGSWRRDGARVTFQSDGVVIWTYSNGSTNQGRWAHLDGTGFNIWPSQSNPSHVILIRISPTGDYIYNGDERWLRE